MILLGKIEDVFPISGRGLVVVPDLLAEPDPMLVFRVGDKVKLRDKDGRVFESQLKGIEFLMTRVMA